jgi:hypothetical protein
MEKAGVACEIVRLVDHEIPPGTYSSMGPDDEWPEILRKVLASDIVVFATPVWWSNQSSLMQRVTFLPNDNARPFIVCPARSCRALLPWLRSCLAASLQLSAMGVR